MCSLDDSVDIPIDKKDNSAEISQETERSNALMETSCEDGEFFIERIIKKRLVDKKPQFLVKWLGAV